MDVVGGVSRFFFGCRVVVLFEADVISAEWVVPFPERQHVGRPVPAPPL
jgi:hypothetical protein